MHTLNQHMIQDIKKTSLYSDLNYRVIAFLIDTTLIVFWLSIFVYFLFGLSDQASPVTSHFNFQYQQFIDENSGTQLWWVGLYFIVIHWLYHVFMEASPRQATIGKIATGIKVADLRGRRISIFRANLRYFLKLLSIGTFFLGFLMAMVTRRKQALHDYLAQCIVIRF